MTKYTLKEGVVLRPYGVNSLLTNEYLTDDVVEMLINKGRAELTDFIIKEDKKVIKKQIKKTVKNGNNK
tara:strand:+ start:3189 stop:3395 length:207 start_codon:yes stop_codon:yes gene_type:complete